MPPPSPVATPAQVKAQDAPEQPARAQRPPLRLRYGYGADASSSNNTQREFNKVNGTECLTFDR